MAARVAAIADSIAPEVAEPFRSEIVAVRAALDEPLRVAIVGRLKAGKSTLVNAILGQRVAPTDVSECTRMVTFFRFGHPQRVEVRLRDGGTLDVPLDADGRVPESVGPRAAEVAFLQVWLANEALRGMTLVDTPGLSSLDEERSRVTEELLAAEQDSSAAAATADSVVLVLNQSPRADELEALQTFQAHGGDSRRSSVDAIGVLTKADQVGGGGAGAMDAARKMAARQADRFRAEVATVVPVIGLVAETAEAAALTEREAADLAALAEIPPDTMARLLLSADRFVTTDAPVDAQARRRLIGLLGLYGVEQAVALAASGVHGAFALRGELSHISGVDAVRTALDVTFRRHSDALKASRGLAALGALSYRLRADAPALATWLRDQVERLKLEPELHELAELESLQAVRSGEISLPDDLAEDLERVVTAGGLAERLGVDPEDVALLRSAATQGVARWRTYQMSGVDPRQAHLARVMIRSYTLAFQHVEGAAS
jgi:dynamin family protein